MSEPTSNIADSEHEHALDYAYGDLDGEVKAAFERHLESCGRCQAEVASVKRVRQAVRAAMPLVEPPQAATGASHAKLLHFAAQRKPPQTGKLLTFARRIVSHPGYAAAAGLLVVGGVIGLQFTRGGLRMAAPAQEAAPMASAPVEAAPHGAAAAKDDAPAAADKEEQDTTRKAAVAAEAKKATNEPNVYLDVKGGAPMKVAHSAPKKAAPADDFAPVLDGKIPNTGVGHVTGRVSGGPPATKPSSRGVVGELGGNGSASGSRSLSLDGYEGGEPAKAAPRRDTMNQKNKTEESAPPSPSYAQQQAQSPRGYYRESTPSTSNAAPPPSSWNNAQAESAPQAAATPPVGNAVAQPAPQAPPPSPPAQNYVQNEKAAAQSASPALTQPNENNLQRAGDDLRKKAEKAASDGNCELAVKLYKELEQRYPTYRMAPSDRIPYVRCLRMTGNEQMADELDSPPKPAPSVAAESPSAAPPRSYKASKKSSKKAAPAADTKSSY